MKITELRKKLKMTAGDLAAEIDATAQSVGNWEREGFETDNPRIHRIFRKQLARLEKKIQ